VTAALHRRAGRGRRDGRGRPGHHALGVRGRLALEPVARVADLDPVTGRRAVDGAAALLDDVGQVVQAGDYCRCGGSIEGPSIRGPGQVACWSGAVVAG
jgi:hypothetical protein